MQLRINWLEVCLVSPHTEPSVCAAFAAEESGICVDGGHHHGAGDRGEHGDLQRGACGAVGAAAVPRCGPGGAGMAHASADELSGDEAVCCFGGELSGLAEAEPCV